MQGLLPLLTSYILDVPILRPDDVTDAVVVNIHKSCGVVKDTLLTISLQASANTVARFVPAGVVPASASTCDCKSAIKHIPL